MTHWRAGWRLLMAWLTSACLLPGMAGLLLAGPLRAETAAPVAIVFDTDMYGDIDDALALAALHALADRAEARIAAVTLSTGGSWPAAFVRAVNRYYGRDIIPVGVVTGGVTEESTRATFTQRGWQAWLPSPDGINYTQESARQAGEVPRPADDAVRVLRQVLAAAPDHAVVVVQAGFGTNLARLLESAPDSFSPLDGRALVASKVRLLVMMAGNFAKVGTEGGAASQPEFNLLMDVPSAQSVVTQWPTRIVFSGYEIGAKVRFPQRLAERGFAAMPGNPVAVAYHHALTQYLRASGHPEKPHDHATFDITAVLHAVRPDDGYFSLSAPGTVSVMADGSSRFSAGGAGRHQFLQLPDDQKLRLQEAISLLVTQPPARRLSGR